MSIRSRLLNRGFRLLYGPLQFLHEPSGRCLFGSSWHGRRIETLARLPNPDRLLDVGCGAGLLLHHALSGRSLAVGVDPSRAMLRRAYARGNCVVAARSNRLPFTGGSFDAIIATYPGNWILDEATWHEFARVLVPGGSVAVLFGGTVERGRLGTIRSMVTGILYGRRSMDASAIQLSGPADAGFIGKMTALEDRWGKVYRWEGRLQ